MRSVDAWCSLNGVNPRERDPRVWRAWAIAVLADCGLLPEPVPGASIGDLIAGRLHAVQAWDLRLRKLIECEGVAPRSPEWFASQIEAASMFRNAARVVGADEALSAEHVTMMVGELLTQVERERLLPDATYGEWVRGRERRAGAQGHKGGRTPLIDDPKRLAGAERRLGSILTARGAARRRLAEKLASDAGVKVESVLRAARRHRKRTRS
jgi:hypothetical protein